LTAVKSLAGKSVDEVMFLICDLLAQSDEAADYNNSESARGGKLLHKIFIFPYMQVTQ